eukprot:6164924-Amphidinium_carterae.1
MPSCTDPIVPQSSPTLTAATVGATESTDYHFVFACVLALDQPCPQLVAMAWDRVDFLPMSIFQSHMVCMRHSFCEKHVPLGRNAKTHAKMKPGNRNLTKKCKTDNNTMDRE